jgi:hypothetical protein
MEQSGRIVALTGVRNDVYTALENAGIVDHLGKERVFREIEKVWSSTMSAVRWAYQHIGAERCAHCPFVWEKEDATQGWHFMI